MALISPTLPTIGQPNATEDQDIVNVLTAILGLVNGGLDTANLAAAAGISAAQLSSAVTGALGLSSAGRDQETQAAAVSTTSTSYVNLGSFPAVVVTQPDPGLTFLWASALQRTTNASFGAYTGYQIDGGTVNNYTIMESISTSNETRTTAPVSDPGPALNSPPGVGHNGFGFFPQLGGPLVFDLAGTHGYQLVHGAGGGGATAHFADRKLRVWTMGF